MRRLAVLLLFAIAPPAIAQDAPTATPEPATASTLEFDDLGNRMTIPVSIAGAGPYAFIVDTGAQRTVISRELATTLGLGKGRNVRLMSMSGPGNVGTVLIPSLGVSTIDTDPIEAPLLESVNLGAPGILGIDTLQQRMLDVDFIANQMTLRTSKKRPQPRPKEDEIIVRAKSQFGQLIVTDAYYRGRRIRVVMDTGSSVSMGNLAMRRLVRKTKSSGQIELLSVIGGRMISDYAILDDLQLGSTHIGNLPVAFADAPPFRLFGLQDKPALMLGMDALRLFRGVQIDFANREVRFALPRDIRVPL